MGLVATYGKAPTEHETAGRTAVARALAALKGYEFGGNYDSTLRRNGHLYYVPAATLDAAEARALGIAGEDDLFGGVVPHCFVASKTIAHPLGDRRAQAPKGWLEAFPERVREVVLPGFSAFTPQDAARAAKTLLAYGPVRIKPGYGIGGKVMRTAIARAQRFDAAAGAAYGGLIASRRNYDVLRGRDRHGNSYCAVHARSTEIYGEGTVVPPGAIVHFRGVDSVAGPLAKYTLVEPYAHVQ